MSIRRVSIPLTLNGSGAGTASSTYPVLGEVLEVRGTNAVLGTATYTVTRSADGGTIWNATGVISPFSAFPRGQVNTGGSAVAFVPSDGYVQVVASSGPASQAGTIHVIYKD